MIRIANVCVPGPGSDTVARLGFLNGLYMSSGGISMPKRSVDLVKVC